MVGDIYAFVLDVETSNVYLQRGRSLSYIAR